MRPIQAEKAATMAPTLRRLIGEWMRELQRITDAHYADVDRWNGVKQP
jgi:hypothetical protein